jgi:hypothetical protein
MVLVDLARAPGMSPVPAQHAHTFSVVDDMVRRASRSAARASTHASHVEASTNENVSIRKIGKICASSITWRD